jgi:hypothetical protein
MGYELILLRVILVAGRVSLTIQPINYSTSQLLNQSTNQPFNLAAIFSWQVLITSVGILPRKFYCGAEKSGVSLAIEQPQGPIKKKEGFIG